MYPAQIKQIHQENNQWFMTLDVMNQDCISMKDRLSKLVDMFNAPDVIDWAEQFQNLILLKEEAIDLMKHDLRTQEGLIEKYDRYPTEKETSDPQGRQDMIRRQINYLEKDFAEMKQSFNDYLSEHRA
jgi:hypothetical protein